MFDPALLFGAICLYMGLLFAVALWGERRAKTGRDPANHPLVYSLSLAVYCTAWTYYGSVGKAASSGFLFLAIYLGPTLAILFWWQLLRRLVRIKSLYHITSLADFISLRYGKSQALAALATLLVLAGITPYIALQIKAIVSTFNLLAVYNIRLEDGLAIHSYREQLSWVMGRIGPLVTALLIVFTIVFGARRLDPTERHQGMVLAVSAECLVKLLAFLTVGVFVTWFLHQGPGDLLQLLAQDPRLTGMLITGGPESSYLTWLSFLLLSAGAVMFLPRQFHMAVVENFDERHIPTAMWVFPLYMLLINLFVVPIAASGLLHGFSAEQADTFVLRLPLRHGQGWLALLVFLGGFSAASGMVMIAAMSLATMLTNHLALPLAERLPALAFLRRRLLPLRWLAIAGIIGAGYWFKREFAEGYLLVDMGIISFAAVLQFVPAVAGGLFWRRGTRRGALWGLGAGFAVWAYTLLTPALVKNGWLPAHLLDPGPGGIALLAPERLLGLVNLDPLGVSVTLSLGINLGLYVLGSLLDRPSPAEQRLADQLVDCLNPRGPWQVSSPQEQVVELADKLTRLERLLGEYLPAHEASALLGQAVKDAALQGLEQVSLLQLADLSAQVESALAGVIGAATAHSSLSRAGLFSSQEAELLSVCYADMLARLKVSPQEMRRRLDYYQAKELLLRRETELLLRSQRVFEEKLQALDHLARSVAHEIRNPVVSIGGLAQRLLAHSGPESKDARYLRKILESVAELEKIVREVRAYADLPAPRPMEVDLGQLTAHMAGLYKERCARLGVELTLENQAGQRGQVVGSVDPYLLEKALAILMDNALEAMPQGGRLRLGLSSNGREANLGVSDSGPGINPLDLPYIFDPFFSTKAEAVGMSLAIARRIAMDHQGEINALTPPGGGASFVLTIPLKPSALPSQQPTAERAPSLK